MPWRPFRIGRAAARVGLLLGLAACTTVPDEPSGGAAAPRRFQNWTDLRFENVVRQQTDFSCGSASLAILGRYLYGRDISEQAVTDAIKTHYSAEEWAERERDGLSMLDLKIAAEGFGFAAEGARITLKDLARLRGPVIVHLDKGIFQHFSVFRGIRGDRVYLADPIGGNVRMPVFQFADEWTGNVLIVWIDDGRPLPPGHALTLHADAEIPELLDVRRALYSTAPPIHD